MEVVGLAEWIMVVDDDLIVLKSAGQILSKNHDPAGYQYAGDERF